jgi:hypothetical protein
MITMDIPKPFTCAVSELSFYLDVPPGFRLATMDDIRKGRLSHNTPYLGLGLDGRYYCKRIYYTIPSGLIPFVEQRRVYIYTGSTRTGDSQRVKTPKTHTK